VCVCVFCFMCVPLSAECSAAALALCDIRCDIVITFKESTQAAVLGAGGWGACSSSYALHLRTCYYYLHLLPLLLAVGVVGC
jgi:hypothetical protein